jgi:GTPase Era involved in 16S rRNA processing
MADRFRVLIIGRGNAGKTTILQKVCNTTEQPEIFDSEGNKVDTSVIAPTAQRGIHKIENELVFQSNSGFIFHDSRGFEAGGVEELNLVKDFIAQRSKLDKIKSQLHVIWYCIPMDDERPFTAAEQSFFSLCGTGSGDIISMVRRYCLK